MTLTRSALAGMSAIRNLRRSNCWRSGVAVACAAACLAATTSCSSQGNAGRRVRIAIGGQTQMVYLPTTLADALGFYREEGVEVELQDFEGGAKALQAMVGGSADVVSGYYDHVIQMAAERRELIAFVTMLRYPGLVLVASPRATSGVTSIGELRGKVAGVTSPGSSSQMFLNHLLTRQQVPIDSVSVTAIGAGASAVAGLESGRIDVAWLAEPTFTLVRRRNPTLRILADLRGSEGTQQAFGVTSYPSAVLYTQGEWLRDNRDLAARLARAIVKTLSWMSSHSEEEIAAATPKALRGDDDALYIEALKNSRAMFSTDGLMSADGAAIVHQVLGLSMPKVHDAVLDLSGTYTNEFATAR